MKNAEMENNKFEVYLVHVGCVRQCSEDIHSGKHHVNAKC